MPLPGIQVPGLVTPTMIGIAIKNENQNTLVVAIIKAAATITKMVARNRIW